MINSTIIKHLTLREEQCMHGMMDGLTAKEIALNLNISYRTVELHISNLRKKLNSKNKCMAIRRFIEVSRTFN